MSGGNLGDLEIRSVADEQMCDLLEWLHPEAPPVEIATLLAEYRHRQALTPAPRPLEAMVAGKRIAATYFTRLPGNVAMLGAVRSAPNTRGIGTILLQTSIAELRRLQVTQIQATLVERDHSAIELVRSAGLHFVTKFDQLWCSLGNRSDTFRSAARDAQAGSTELHWRPASDFSKKRLTMLLGDTFVDTLDCPELNGIRTDRDALNSFLMGKPLRRCPEWEVFEQEGSSIGCLFLNQHSVELVELVYMGLIPAARGKGFGKIMIEHARVRAAEMGANMLVAAVDQRNTPAVVSYRKHQFQHHLTYDVFLLTP